MRNTVGVILAHELRRRRLYMLWWCLGIILLIALTILAYGSVKSQADQLNKAFAHLSSSISGFVGTSDMFSPVGYLNSQLYYITLPILFIILTVTLAGSLLRKEEHSGTLELLLARPVGRTRLLVAKALAGAAVVAVIGAITTAATLLCCLAVHIDVPAWHVVLATFWMIVFSGAFGAIAFMLYAASLVTQRLAAAVAIVLSLGGYILTSLGSMVHGLSGVAKLLPYHYYNPGDILNGHIASGLVIYCAALYLLSLAVAVAGFRRRDIE